MAELTTVYKCTNGANFPVQWQSPEDGQLNWVRDASHFPYPLTPLAVDFTRRVYEDSGYRHFWAWRRGFPTLGHVRTTYPLGFVYRLVPEPAEQDAYLQEYGRRVVEMAPSIRCVWKREWEPQIRAACHWLQRDDYLSMDLPPAYNLPGTLHGRGCWRLRTHLPLSYLHVRLRRAPARFMYERIRRRWRKDVRHPD